MSSLKRQADKAETLCRIAEEVAVLTGLLARCPECRETYDPLTWLYEKAYRLANHLITRRDDLGDDDRPPLTDALKSITKDFPNTCSCGACGFR
jgi:hypothetical protein